MIKITWLLLLVVVLVQCFSCNGWYDREPRFFHIFKKKTCFTGLPCKVVLPQHGSHRCQIKRKQYLFHQRRVYDYTTPPSANDPNRKPSDILLPMLNQTVEDCRKMAMTDPFTAHWFNLYYLVLATTSRNVITPKLKKLVQLMNFTSYNDYLAIWNSYKKGMKAIKLPYFRFSSDQKYFQDITNNLKWKEDKYFVQERLAGLNPLAIKAVTKGESVGINWKDLRKRLNPTFKWMEEIKKVVGGKRLFRKILENRLLYVVEYPVLNDIPTVPDLYAKFNPKPREMLNHTSPIAIFAVCQKKNCYGELKAVAIQTHFKYDSDVFKPSDGYNWEFAKLQVQLADILVSSIYNHLLRVHLRMEPVCLAFKRHLSSFHPLYDVLKYHCRGTLEVNNNGLVSLLAMGKALHQLASVGHIGSTKIVNDGYLKMRWGDNDLLTDIAHRGVGNKKSLPYYPFRDDGKVWYFLLKRFSRDLVHLYYDEDYDVEEDYELQDMMNELSSEGKRKPNGGKGMVKGLPPSLKSRSQLEKFLKEVIWILVEHAAVSYPIQDFGSVTPIMPLKLYNDPRAKAEQNSIYNLPDRFSALGQTALAVELASFHYDQIFDYSPQLHDESARRLVHRYFMELKTRVKPLLENRRRKRFANEQFTYPYLDPSSVTNSIST